MFQICLTKFIIHGTSLPSSHLSFHNLPILISPFKSHLTHQNRLNLYSLAQCITRHQPASAQLCYADGPIQALLPLDHAIDYDLSVGGRHLRHSPATDHGYRPSSCDKAQSATEASDRRGMSADSLSVSYTHIANPSSQDCRRHLKVDLRRADQSRPYSRPSRRNIPTNPFIPTACRLYRHKVRQPYFPQFNNPPLRPRPAQLQRPQLFRAARIHIRQYRSRSRTYR